MKLKTNGKIKNESKNEYEVEILHNRPDGYISGFNGSKYKRDDLE